METELKLVIIGYSGHSFGCIEVINKLGYSISGYCDISENVLNPYKLKYLGYEDNINLNGKSFITIGHNNIRSKVYEKLKSKHIDLNITLIHPNSIISTSSFIEEQTFISAGVIVNPQVKIGFACIINTGAIIEHDCIIGEFSHIAPGAVLAGNVKVGRGCFIGANSVIKQGVKIGDNVTVGAGAVVLNDLNSNEKYVGNPAKLIMK